MPNKAPLGRKIGGSHHKEKFPDFLLKNNDQCNKSDLHKPPDHTTYHFHVEQFGKFPKAPNDYDSYKDIYGNRSADQFVDIIEEYRNKNNVNKVGNPKVEKV